LRTRKPQETQALALASSQSWLPVATASTEHFYWLALAFEWKPGLILLSGFTATQNVMVKHSIKTNSLISIQ